ncbi:MAG: ATP-dependent RNA helicase HrpA [Gammaproteobacteria bacterium]
MTQPDATLRDLQSLLDEAMYVDQPGLRRRLARESKRERNRGRRPDRRGDADSSDSSDSSRLQDLEIAITASAERASARAQSLPLIDFPAALPISERREEIASAIDANQVLILCGETGSGKSTQLPKICLQIGRGVQGLIGHTQPRRIAARATAARIASELGEPLGERVGYKIRFADRTGPDCRLKLMTDGILLAEIQKDRWLRHYDTLIIDEAHERSLNIDFLLGYFKRLLPRRPELKLIITSATIDPGRFSAHFDDAPVIEVSGRTWPVETRYRPLVSEDDEDGRDQVTGILDAVDELCAQPGRGDVLVFLAGERDIRETADALRRHHPKGVDVLPLFARLSAAEQDRVFHSGGARRVVLATNIAETSLTVPGIRFVVDPGRARISRYSYRSKIQRLQIEAISRASADQRQGRCGRERDGICIRLYSDMDYDGRPAFTDPEVLRTNLASVILQMETLGLGHIEDFPFLDSPDPRFVRDGYRLLRELGAADEEGGITEIGRRVARLPVDPRLGRILLAAGETDCLTEVLAIVSMLSIQDPRERPLEHAAAADERHACWQVEGSDFLSIYKLWVDYLEQRHHQSVSKQRRWCKENFLSFLRMREWYDVHQQLLQQLAQMGLRPGRRIASADEVHRALLSGFLGHIGRRDEDGHYRGPRDSAFLVGRGSVMNQAKAPWVMAASLVQTSRVFARTVAGITPDWIESVAAHLVKRQYDDPRWAPKRGQVTASETVSLYGLVLASGRRVDYSRIDPEAARRIFLEDGLADMEQSIQAPFATHNRTLLASLEDMEARVRRRDLIADPARIAAFFDRRVPADICSLRDFQAWRKKAEKSDPRCLFMELDDLLASDLPRLDPDSFPDALQIEGNTMALSYTYDPAADDDGVTVMVPRDLLGMLSEADLEWLVPGLLQEKVVALVRGLPKAIRRRLVPVPATVDSCMPVLDASAGKRLLPCLAQALQRAAGAPVPEQALESVSLPDYLRCNVRVMDTDGSVLGEGRDLAALRDRLAPAGPVARPAAAARSDTRTQLDWKFDTLPRTACVAQDGHERNLFPALHDEGDGVSLAYFAAEDEARAEHRDGVLRLLRLQAGREEKYLRREFAKNKVLNLTPDLGSGGGDLSSDLVHVAALKAFLEDSKQTPRDEDGFRRLLATGLPGFVPAGTALADLVAAILQHWRKARLRIDELPDTAATAHAAEDLRYQLGGLVYPGFLLDTPTEWLGQCPRFLQAVHLRLDKLAAGDARDVALTNSLAPFQARLRERLQQTNSIRQLPSLTLYRWMVEECRVSLFAQTLGTSIKISPQRLERQWEKVIAESRPR